jgi:hypothetical protein
VFQGMLDFVDQVRVDAVHQTAADLLHGAPEQDQDRHGDQ